MGKSRATSWNHLVVSYTEPDFYLNIRLLLIRGCFSPIISTDAECAASSVRRLKTSYHSAMSDDAWLATCARKHKAPGSSPAGSYVQR